MRLSVVFELLLVFLFLAFAAARVIDPKTGTKIIAKEKVKATILRQGPPNRYCACTTKMCNCCRDFSLPVVPVKGPGCASIMYAQKDTMMVTLSFGDRVLTNTTISGKSPKPICMNLPGGISQFCGRVYGISRNGDQFRACLGLELRALDDIEAALRISCFKFGPKGVNLESAPPVPVSGSEKEPEDDDEDDDDDDDDYDLEDGDDFIGFDDDDDDEEEDDDEEVSSDNEVDSDSVDYTGFSVLGEDFLGSLFSESGSSSSNSNNNIKRKKIKTARPQLPLQAFSSTTRIPLLPIRKRSTVSPLIIKKPIIRTTKRPNVVKTEVKPTITLLQQQHEELTQTAASLNSHNVRTKIILKRKPTTPSPTALASSLNTTMPASSLSIKPSQSISMNLDNGQNLTQDLKNLTAHFSSDQHFEAEKNKVSNLQESSSTTTSPVTEQPVTFTLPTVKNDIKNYIKIPQTDLNKIEAVAAIAQQGVTSAVISTSSLVLNNGKKPPTMLNSEQVQMPESFEKFHSTHSIDMTETTEKVLSSKNTLSPTVMTFHDLKTETQDDMKKKVVTEIISSAPWSAPVSHTKKVPTSFNPITNAPQKMQEVDDKDDSKENENDEDDDYEDDDDEDEEKEEESEESSQKEQGNIKGGKRPTTTNKIDHKTKKPVGLKKKPVEIKETSSSSYEEEDDDGDIDDEFLAGIAADDDSEVDDSKKKYDVQGQKKETEKPTHTMSNSKLTTESSNKIKKGDKKDEDGEDDDDDDDDDDDEDDDDDIDDSENDDDGDDDDDDVDDEVAEILGGTPVSQKKPKPTKTSLKNKTKVNANKKGGNVKDKNDDDENEGSYDDDDDEEDDDTDESILELLEADESEDESDSNKVQKNKTKKKGSPIIKATLTPGILRPRPIFVTRRPILQPQLVQQTVSSNHQIVQNTEPTSTFAFQKIKPAISNIQTVFVRRPTIRPLIAQALLTRFPAVQATPNIIENTFKLTTQSPMEESTQTKLPMVHFTTTEKMSNQRTEVIPTMEGVTTSTEMDDKFTKMAAEKVIYGKPEEDTTEKTTINKAESFVTEATFSHVKPNLKVSQKPPEEVTAYQVPSEPTFILFNEPTERFTDNPVTIIFRQSAKRNTTKGDFESEENNSSETDEESSEEDLEKENGLGKHRVVATLSDFKYSEHDLEETEDLGIEDPDDEETDFDDRKLKQLGGIKVEKTSKKPWKTLNSSKLLKLSQVPLQPKKFYRPPENRPVSSSRTHRRMNLDRILPGDHKY